MIWITVAVVVLVLLIAAYGVVRLRPHATDPISPHRGGPGADAPDGRPGTDPPD